MKELQVGDVIIAENRLYSMQKYKIERTTKTQAISGKAKFRREYIDSGQVTMVGSRDPFSYTTFYIATPELEHRYRRQKMLFTIKGADFSKLDDEALGLIYSKIKESKLEEII